MKSKRRNHVRCTNIKVKSGVRRGRRGKKSSLYTRFRCEPDPWQGSPPQTPPSSDDESNDIVLKKNVNYSNKNSNHGHNNKINNNNNSNNIYQNQRNHQHNNHHHNNSNNHYKNSINNNNNNSSNNGMSMRMPSSRVSVAPAPLNNNNNNNSHNTSHDRNKRMNNTINQVRRNLNEYIRMENANVIQSRQSCVSQTTLTAPAPPKLKFQKTKTRVKCKQTAPVPMNITNRNANNSTNNITQNITQKITENITQNITENITENNNEMNENEMDKHMHEIIVTNDRNDNIEKSDDTNMSNDNIANMDDTNDNNDDDEFQMTALAKPFIPQTVEMKVNRETVVFSVKKNEENMETVETIETEEDNDDMIDIALIPEAYFVGCAKSENNNNKINDKSNNIYDELNLNSKDFDFDFDFDDNSLNGEAIEFDDSLHSRSTATDIEHSDVNTNSSSSFITPPRAIFSDDDNDTLFDDSKFYSLAEQILDEPEDNIAWKFSNNSPYSQQRTLGGLLMHGIPPINANRLFH